VRVLRPGHADWPQYLIRWQEDPDLPQVWKLSG